MRKVMFVIGVLSNGGAERVISILAKEMSNRGYEVSIVTVFGDNNNYVTDKRITLYPIKQKYKNKMLRVMKIVRKTRQIIKRQNPDLIISFDATINLYTIISCTFLPNKLIVSERNDPYQYPGNKGIRRVRDFLYRFCDGFVFQTEDAKKYFSSRIQEKGVVIPNPITSNLPYWNEENSEKTIITASRLNKQKNLPMLINAYSKIKDSFPEYKLKIFGVGELRDELLDQIEQSGLSDKITLPGFSNDIHNEMANSDLFVIPSDYEGISNSMLEALAIGVPVISTDSPIGGAKMFIKNEENGLLIKVGDTDGLVQAMNKVLSDKNFAKHLSYEARKIREDLKLEKIAKNWVEFAQKIYRGSHE
ncbi:glycosyltransferase family 4 protein [Bacillus cytotoxicus]|uniref:glycosyltransferase family 4 protein n=1 Tax=Bacillus cytotoxicus TaxID=580165 RepID=UPI0035C97F7D